MKHRKGGTCMNDHYYMQLALDLAKKGMGKTSPNPMVGAVIVKEDRIIGQGYHTKCGSLHAEREAFASLTESAEDATLYVTLEPCCHYGKTPPCTEAILEHKIKRVVVAALDPNPLVAGKGIEILKKHGIAITIGVMEKEALALNHVFFYYITKQLPYVVMKYAMTADGKIATHTGKSRWITGEEARAHVHSLRNQYYAIMAGIGTVLMDNPLLTCRIPGGINPVRIICDTNFIIPLDCAIMQTAKEVPTYIACHSFDKEKRKLAEELGAVILETPLSEEHLDLTWLLKKCASLGIDSILAEGGGTLHESLLKTHLVNALKVYLAPKIFGGKFSKTPVEGAGIDEPEDAYAFQLQAIRQLGSDLLLEYSTEGKESSLRTEE